VREEETRKAAAAGEQILARMREAAARDRDRVFDDLRREVGRLVVQTAAAAIGRMLTPDDQQRLVLQTVDALDGAPAAEGVRPSSEATAVDRLLREGSLGVTGDESNPASATGR
jgi:hypothetical protein